MDREGGVAQGAGPASDPGGNSGIGRRARRGSCRYQSSTARSGLQASHVRIAVDRLEQVLAAVAGVTGLKRGVLAELALETEAPGVYPVRLEIRGHGGVIKLPRVGYARCQ